MPSFLPDLLRYRALRTPDAPAFTVNRVTIGFRDWYAQAAAAHAELVNRGVRPGDRVLLEFPDEDWGSFAAAFLAVLAAGGAAVPIRHPMPDAHRATLVGIAAPVGSLTGAHVPLPTAGLDMRWRVPMDDLAPARDWSRGPRPARDEPASIIFTSGTTGTPRAVVCPHADLVPARRVRWRPPPPRARALLTSVAVGTVAAQSVVASCLVNGVHTVVVNPFDPAAVADLVVKHGVTALSLVPSTARMAADALRRSGRTLPGVLSVVSSSAALDQPTVAALAAVLPAAQIANAYTLSEGGPSLVSHCAPDRPPALGKLGRDVRLADHEGRDVSAGEVGEVWLRARTVPRRYLGDSGTSSAAVTAASGTRMIDGWIATGDLCRRGPDGLLYFLDRGDDIIVSGGLKMAPAVVEAAIRRHPAVRDAAVVGVPHPVLGQVAVAAVVLAPGAAVSEVREHCLAVLPPHEVPTEVVAVPGLPMTANSKVRKGELAERLAGGSARPEANPSALPSSSEQIEALVAAALGAAVGADSVNADSNFYLIGGYSMLAAQVAVELSTQLQTDVPVSWVLRYPVVRDLAARISRLREQP